MNTGPETVHRYCGGAESRSAVEKPTIEPAAFDGGNLIRASQVQDKVREWSRTEPSQPE